MANKKELIKEIDEAGSIPAFILSSLSDKFLGKAVVTDSVTEWVLKNKMVTETGKPIEFDNHSFLTQVYNDWTPKQYMCKCSQSGWTTMEIIKALYAAGVRKNSVIYTLPTDNDCKEYVKTKFNMIVEQNPVLKALVSGDTMSEKRVGDRYIFFKATFSESAAIMTSSDLNIHDEVDRSNLTTVDQYRSRLDHSKYKGRWLFSNPSTPSAPAYKGWINSCQYHWHIKCSRCNEWQELTWPDSINIEKKEYICLKCKEVLRDEDRARGEWIAKFPDLEGEVHGYWLNHLMCPWKSAKDIIEFEEDSSKDVFYNFCLGLPYKGSDVTPSRKVIEEITRKRNEAPEGSRYFMGVDQGELKHYVLGTEKGVIQIGETKHWEEIENLIEKYQPVTIIDSLPDLTPPRKLQQKYKRLVYLHSYRPERVGFEAATSLLRWGAGDRHGTVVSDKTRTTDAVLDDMIAGRFLLFIKEDLLYETYIEDWQAFYKEKRVSARTGKEEWVWTHSNTEGHFGNATIYWWIGRTLANTGMVYTKAKENKEKGLFDDYSLEAVIRANNKRCGKSGWLQV